MKYLIVAIVGSMVGLAIGFGLGTSKYKGELEKVILKFKDVEGIDKTQSFDKVTEVLEKKLTQKELEIERIKDENNKMSIKLANLENQFTELLNDMMKQGNENRQLSFVDSKDNREEPKEKRSPEELMKEISSLIEGKDMVSVAKLLRQLAAYGKEYYQFISEVIRKMFEGSGGGRRFDISRREVFKVLGAPEFVDYYKWVIENPNFDNRAKWGALDGLLWAGGEEVKPFIFEQFKSQTDPRIRSMLFGALAGSDEYKNSFIEVAKDLSQDPQLRKRIVLEYRNDNSPEVQNLFNFLKTNEIDEDTKKMVNIISEVRNNSDKGYVVFKGSEILKEKDIVLKVGDKEINSDRQFGGPMPFMWQQGGAAKNTDENITLTVKREGAIITVDMPRSKLREEFRTIEGAYVGTK